MFELYCRLDFRNLACFYCLVVEDAAEDQDSGHCSSKFCCHVSLSVRRELIADQATRVANEVI